MPAKRKTIDKKFTKTEIVNYIAEDTELSKADINAVLSSLSDVIQLHIRKRSCGEFVLPGLLKIKTKKKDAVKARKGINPFTGEETMFKAKPATTVVKILPLKGLKDMAL